MKHAGGILIVGIMLGLVPGLHAAPILFVVSMDGQQEVPGPGDPDGTGTALLSIDPATLTLNLNISLSNIDLPVTGAHIHQGPVGVAGPIVVDFGGQLTGVGLLDADLLAIAANPANYYVNVHNASFPAGAIRGQLGAAVPVPSALGLVVLGLIGLRLSYRKLA